ncbi:MAG: hypothetical protein IT422_03970, partial [Pirellulaceae bacterium]|nr:hypothetical protein [Pirellulaceae bacterium]
MTFRPLQTLAGSPKRLRARLGAKWSVAILLIPPSLFGVYQFGPRAALVLAVSVIGCQLAGALPRWLAGQSVQ